MDVCMCACVHFVCNLYSMSLITVQYPKFNEMVSGWQHCH
jgi:hypothetical protein